MFTNPSVLAALVDGNAVDYCVWTVSAIEPSGRLYELLLLHLSHE